MRTNTEGDIHSKKTTRNEDYTEKGKAKKISKQRLRKEGKEDIYGEGVHTK